MSRTRNSIKNIKFSILGQFITFIFNFIARIIFVQVLNAEYLGLNGLFSNILSVLSFAELGIGTAIVYSMYKPLAQNDNQKLKSLMNLYRNSYTLIGAVILVLGASLTPFLEYFVKDMPDIPNIRSIYMMYVLSSGISYFYSYKRSILFADQKKYIESIYHYSFYIIRIILQVIILLTSRNFLLYLGIQILCNIAENVLISIKVGKLYPFLNERNIAKIDLEEKIIIIKNVKAMVFHKLGSIVVLGTDNLLISKFVGIVEVGLYSNYLLIMSALNQLFLIFFQSITASIGNLGVTEKSEKSEFIFNCIDLLGFWIYAFASICLINLFNPFIRLWLGDEYIFSFNVVILIIINFYLNGRRQSIMTFRNALGLFWYDRHKPFFEACINLIVSIILVKRIGISGIFIGTITSTILACVWVEPYILYKYGFNTSVKSYFIKYLFSTLFMISVGYITWLLSNIFSSYTFYGLIGKILICTIVPNFIFLMFFWRTKELRYLISIIEPFFSKIFINF